MRAEMLATTTSLAIRTVSRSLAVVFRFPRRPRRVAAGPFRGKPKIFARQRCADFKMD